MPPLVRRRGLRSWAGCLTSGQPKTQGVVAGLGGERVAIRRTDASHARVTGAASDNPERARARRSWLRIDDVGRGISSQCIEAPFVDVAQHVVQAKGVGILSPDGVRPAVRVRVLLLWPPAYV